MKKISIIKVKPYAMGKKSENQLDYNKGIAENSHHWDLRGIFAYIQMLIKSIFRYFGDKAYLKV